MITGLSEEEARRRIVADGPNAIPDVAQHPISRALGKLWAPVPWMLEVAILLQLLLGEYAGAAGIAVLLLFNAILGFFRESGALSVLDSLKSRLARTTSVQRDGTWKTLPATGLVRGDLIKLSLGAVVPADAQLISGSLLIDQSMLTGESLPVEAAAGFSACAGALVRRGEAVAEVAATGAHTKFGLSAELVRAAHFESTEQKAILLVVRNLAVFNLAVTLVMTGYGIYLAMTVAAIADLVLMALLASIPVALPAMFTLAATVGARAVVRHGVLPTRLSALDEAAGMDILCADKTGTLTCNELAVSTSSGLSGWSTADVLALAAMASSEGGADPVDAAVRSAAGTDVAARWQLVAFTPFDPAKKMSEAAVTDAAGKRLRVVKGAYAVIAAISEPSSAAAAMADGLLAKGLRVLAVAVGPIDRLAVVGMIALADPPRPDSAALVARLHDLGIRTVMVTGDAAVTAAKVADAVGIVGKVCALTPLPPEVTADEFAVFAGILPEDKYALVKSLQQAGHIVGMCGDGVNDAPALRQAQIGIAVFTATDVAKSAAGLVLTEPGLGGVVVAVQEGRKTFQKVLGYTLRSIIHKTVQVLLLLAGLVISGGAILTPLLMVMMMVGGDVLALTSATDHVRPSPTPDVWRIGNLTRAGILLGFCDLLFCVGVLAAGRFVFGLDAVTLRTLTVVTLVCSGQAIFYISRERRHFWSSRPGRWLMLSSILDLGLWALLATRGILMAPLAPGLVVGVFVAAIVLAFVLDAVKVFLFRHFPIE